MNQTILKAISLTLVEYDSSDIFSKLLAYITLTPLFIISGLLTLTFTNRDISAFLFLSGLVVNEMINYTLKHIIKEARPDRFGSRADGYGMPSSHAQFMGFFMVYFFTLKCGRVVNAAVLIISVLVVVSRVYLKYHHVEQVLIGSALGILLGIGYCFLVRRIIKPVIFKLQDKFGFDFDGFLIVDYENINRKEFYNWQKSLKKK